MTDDTGDYTGWEMVRRVPYAAPDRPQDSFGSEEKQVTAGMDDYRHDGGVRSLLRTDKRDHEEGARMPETAIIDSSVLRFFVACSSTATATSRRLMALPSRYSLRH
jgi:hypothetical protein